MSLGHRVTILINRPEVLHSFFHYVMRNELHIYLSLYFLEYVTNKTINPVNGTDMSGHDGI